MNVDFSKINPVPFSHKKWCGVKKIHMIGVGGIMMSAVARYFLVQGKEVSGSDRDETEITEKLEKLGVQVYKEHVAKHVSSDIDLVIYTEALDEDNPELVRAKDLQLPLYTVYQFLGWLSKDKYTIAVAGMHGKSTSASMVGLTMEAAGLDPTVFVGTQIKEFDGNFRSGKSEYLVSEACEYKDNFLNYHSDIGVITNIEAEHLDYFKNLAGVKKSFKKFIGQIKKDGWLVYNRDNRDSLLVTKGYQGNMLSFGITSQADVMAKNVELDEKGVSFEVQSKKFKDFDGIRFSLKVPGEFNIYNALVVICVAVILKIQVQVVQEMLAKFGGVWRRFEFKGERDGILYYDDYAHHPTEIKATLKAVSQKFENKKVWLIYQPHLYSRTNDFLNEFAESLNLADNLILADIYAAREENKWKISSKDIVELINQKYKRKNPAVYLGGFNEINDYLKENVKAGEVVMTMGAGDVYKILEG